MFNQKFSIQTKNILLGLLAVSSVGLVTIPAQADEALIQETVQESYTTGEHNVSVQSSSQHNRQSSYIQGRQDYRNQNNVGIVQRSQQLCDQFGEANTCVQNTRQSNTSRHHRSRY